MEPLNPTILAVAVTALGVSAMFVADRTGLRLLEYVGKPAASLAFLLLGLHNAAGADTAVTCAMLTALALSLVGDVCLMGRSDATFSAGLGAFLAGHAAFIVAFVLRGVDGLWAAAAIVPVAITAALVLRVLMPRVPAPMRVPVIAYTVVIGAMVVCAAGTHGARATPAWLAAAVAFFVSDLAVARQKFVNPSLTNRWWGLPLYFGAQLVFAAHITD